MSDKKNTQKTEDNKLNEEVIKLKKKVEELKNKYLRALADYQNFEKE
jgi:molecular chaperone GrpE